MKKSKLFILILSVLAIAGAFGCSALSHYITPAEIDQRAVDYADAAGVIDVNDFEGYANLDKAIKLETAVTSAYQVKQLSLEQLAEKNNLTFSQLQSVTQTNRIEAFKKEEKLFGEKGLLTLGLSLIGGGSFAGLIGLMRKRPGDITPEQLNNAIDFTEQELANEKRSLGELVQGIQAFFDSDKPKDAEILKEMLTVATSPETKKKIAVLKA